MRIEIHVEESDPPAGSAGAVGAEPRPFVGWLGLLRVLSELILGEPAGTIEPAGDALTDGPAGRP